MIRFSAIIFFTFFLLSTLFAQMDKANELYKNGLYAAAIPLYIKEISSKKSMGAEKKLINCYIRLNKTKEAEIRLSSLANLPDPSNDILLQYAEILVLNGKCDSVGTILKKLEQSSETEVAIKKIMHQCDFIKTNKPLFEKVEIGQFEFNTDADENSPFYFRNQLIFSSDRSSGMKLLKKTSETTGRDYLSIYGTSRINDSTWQTPEKLPSKINEFNVNISGGSFTKDGSKFYFSKNHHTLGKNDVYYLQLFEATFKNGSFSSIEKLPFCISDANYMHPMISPNGKYLFYTSDRGNGNIGATDIYFVKKTKKGWSKPTNLGSTINTESAEGFPYFNANNQLFFCSKGHEGLGGFDIFMSQMDTLENWSKPINLGFPINGSSDDVGICFDYTDKKGVFVSSRNGRADDLFLFEIVEKEKNIIALPTKLDCFQTYPLSDFRHILQNRNSYPNTCFRIDGNKLFVENSEKFINQTDSTLVDLAMILIENPSLVVEIDVYYKNTPDAINISGKRAQSIATFLTENFISPSQFFWKGMGTILDEHEKLDNPISKIFSEQIIVKIVNW